MKRLKLLLPLLSILLLVVACGQSDDAAQVATPTPLPTPIVAEKPEYVVQQGTIVKTLEFTGRVSPVMEQELFFRSDGFVSDVFVARGNDIAVGDIIAQLDIDELEAQLANAQLSLETAETNLDKAGQENEDSIAEAEIQLENSRLQLETAQINLSNAGTDNADALAEARLQVNLSQINLDAAELQLSGAATDNADQINEARANLRNAQLALQIAEINLSSGQLDNTDARREAALQLQNAQLQLQQSQATPRSAQLTQSEIELNSRRDELADAEREWQEVNDRDWATEDEINFYRDNLERAQENLRIAQANYNEALASQNARAQDLQSLQNDVALRQLAVEQANRGVDSRLPLEVEKSQLEVQLRQQALAELERGVDPQLALEIEKARIDLQLKQRSLAELQRGVDPQLALEVEKAELDVSLKELTLTRLERGVDPLLPLDVERERLNVADIERKIANARLTAPFAGRILRLDVQAGDAAQAFDAVAVLAEPGLLEISAELTADDLVDMSVGQEAIIQLRNRPGEELPGIVRQLPAGYSGSTTSGDDDSSARIAFAFDLNSSGETEGTALPFELEIGELASVTIVLQELGNAIWLPPAAIRTFQGRDFVVVREADGTQRRVDVRVGVVSDDRVEIVNGLEPGWIVVGE